MSLSSIISIASSQIKANTGTSAMQMNASVTGAFTGTQTALAGIPAGIVQNAVNTVSIGTNQAINVGLTDVKSAASMAIQGNFSGALDKVMGVSDAMTNSLLKSLGFNIGGTLVGPGGNASTPGNNLAGALARSDPLMSFDWYAVMPDMTPLSGGAPQQLAWYFVEEATPPFRQFEVKSMFREGRQKHYAGSYSVNDLSLGIYMDSAGIAMNYLTAWNGALLSPTTSANTQTKGGGFGRPSGYKKSIFIYLVSAAKKQIVTLEYIECWPTTLNSFALDSGGGSRIINNVSFSVGDVFVSVQPIVTTNALGFTGNGAAGLTTSDLASIQSANGYSGGV